MPTTASPAETGTLAESTPLTAESAPAAGAPTVAEEPDAAAEEPTLADDSPLAEEPNAAAEPATEEPFTDEEPIAESRPRARWRRGPRRSRAASASSTIPSLPAVQVARRPSARRLGRMTTASLAIATLVGGMALPAIGMVQGGTAAPAAADAATDDLRTQSFVASSDTMPDVVVRGDFSATTPEELKEIQAVAAATARSGIAPIAKPGQVIIPMAAGSYSMTDGFGASRPGRSHMGQDYAAAVGTPIYAAADGVVTMSQDSFGGYGVTVQVQHDFGGQSVVSTLYGHMDYGTRAVQAGDRVVAGQFLGRVGTTGYTIGSCLHFEVHINGSPINPVPWLDANVR
ncbi:M23 family metallopeptidase [Streptomyces sp. AC495_CC817]|uniref:M23 family metallopeptidase n=1 Tax=Streptomyces sp. AC495_CC817 TaxID=2823900 RepID=UPI001C261C6E|nr:M23 family metallopeptidase [Streptomyces sp. AC495_CC817]